MIDSASIRVHPHAARAILSPNGVDAPEFDRASDAKCAPTAAVRASRRARRRENRLTLIATAFSPRKFSRVGIEKRAPRSRLNHYLLIDI
jgi:hypothetical protein